MKKLISLLLSATLIITLSVPMGIPMERAYAAEEGMWQDVDANLNFYYEITDGGCRIRGVELNGETAENGTLNLVFPESIEINGASYDVVDLECDYIPDAFGSVVIPSHVKELDYRSGFSDHKYLKTVSFAENSQIEIIGEETFAGKYYSEYSSNTWGITSVTIPDSVKTIGKKAFYNTGLTAVDLPDSLVTIGDSAFQSTKLTEVVIPDSVKTIGKYAFAYTDSPDAYGGVDSTTVLTGLIFGSGLESIGEGAFYKSKIKSLVLPVSLQSIGKDAFAESALLAGVSMAETGTSALAVVDGFRGCTALTSFDMPYSVTKIESEAFSEAGLKSITIPGKVEEIGESAFFKNQNLETISIMPGTASLKIDKMAFYYCNNLTKVTLPERVSVIEDEAFGICPKAEIRIENENIRLMRVFADGSSDEGTADDVSYFATKYSSYVSESAVGSGSAKVIYPAALTSVTSPSFMAYKAACESSSHRDYYPEFSVHADVPDVHSVTGTMPAGAAVIVTVNDTEVAADITDDTVEGTAIKKFTVTADKGSDLTVTVSEEGYADAVFSRSGVHFNSDWNLGNITLTELADTGSLTIETTGAGAVNANIILIDEVGNVAAAGKAAGGVYLGTEIKKGTYTVIAFADNKYVNAVSGEADFAKLGITSYAKDNVTVAAGSNTVMSIAVPAFNASSITGILAGGNMSMQQTYAVKNSEFFVRISYELADGHSADKLNLQIPEGFTIVSAASNNSRYTVAADGTITPAVNDQKKGDIYIGLKATQAGTLNMSASVTSGATTVPIGNIKVTVSRVMLEIPSETQNGTFIGTVYAEPGKTVTIKAGNEQIKTVTTKSDGRWKGELTLPSSVLPGTAVDIFASVEEGSITHTVYKNIAKLEQKVDLIESYFVHANKQTYGVRDSRDVSGGYYTYIANGDEENKYWTFSATIESDEKYLGDVTLEILMMGGTCRYEAMTPIKEYNVGGRIRTEYAATVYIDQAGDHLFEPSLIPQGYDILFDSVPTDSVAEDPLPFFNKGYLDAVAQQTERETVRTDSFNAFGIDEMTEEERQEYIQYIFGGRLEILYEEVIAEIEALPEADLPEGVTREEALEIVQDGIDICDNMIDEIGCTIGTSKSIKEFNSPEEILKDIGIEVENVPVPDFTNMPEDYKVYTTDNNKKIAIKETRTPQNEPRMECITDEGIKLKWDYVADAGKNIAWSGGSNLLGALNTSAYWYADSLDAMKGLTSSKWKCFKGAARVTGAVCQTIYGAAQAMENGQSVISATDEYEKYKGELDIVDTYINYYEMHNASEDCLDHVYAERMVLKEFVEKLDEHLKATKIDACASAGFTAVSAGAFMMSGPLGTVAVESANLAYDVAVNQCNSVRAGTLMLLRRQYEELHKKRLRVCGDIHDSRYRYKVNMDPSGIVYEAVESNTLEDVTATVYETTDGTPVKWNAEEYDQINPQVTASDGMYAWYVPTGKWQVKFAKAGYEDVTTDELDVPPPQMNLKTAMVSKAAPEVTSVNAYTDYVELVFSQYMNTVSELTVPAGYSYEWMDKEKVSDTDATEYAKVLRLTPSAASAVGDTVNVTVAGAENYVGKALPAYNSGSVTVTERPAEIVLNYETTVAAKLGESQNITVRVKDSAGNFMTGVKVNASLANSYLADITGSSVTGADGTAVFTLDTKLPGVVALTFDVDGSSVANTVQVKITTDSNQVERPTAKVGTTTIGAGAPKENYVTVAEGSTLTLECGTDGAKIYYTVNDTCPCQNGGDRILYTGPITVSDNTLYRVAAYKDGMAYSERINIHVTVSSAGAGGGGGSAVIPVPDNPDSGDASDNPGEEDKPDVTDPDSAAKELIESAIAGGGLYVCTTRTLKKNIRAKVYFEAAKELKAMGYSVTYKFYRSTKKTKGYKLRKTTGKTTYVNTTGKKGKRYYYKVKVIVKDSSGNQVYKTVLKNCKPGSRKR